MSIREAHISQALIRQRTADSAAIDSGINALAKSAVKNVMDNVTQTKIASEIKVLALNSMISAHVTVNCRRFWRRK